MIRQIAEHFKDYDEHLILEGFNEMVDEKCHWNKAPYSSLAAYNKWNQLFVDTVRSTGSNNSTRYLLINTYAATYSRINVFFFNMPKDTVDNRLIAGVHNYSEPNNLDKSFKRIEALADKGYPVIIGEFGTIASSDFDRTEHARKYVEMSMERGYCAIWWDNNENPENTPNTSFSLFDRRTNKVYFSNIVEALTEK